MTSGSNWRHLNSSQTEEARRSIPAYHGVPAKLQHFQLDSRTGAKALPNDVTVMRAAVMLQLSRASAPLTSRDLDATRRTGRRVKVWGPWPPASTCRSNDVYQLSWTLKAE